MNRERELLDLADKMDNWDGIGTDAVSGWAERLRAIASQPVGMPELPTVAQIDEWVCFARNEWYDNHEMDFLQNDGKHPDTAIAEYILEKLRTYATQAVGADAKDAARTIQLGEQSFRIVPMELPPGVVCAVHDPAAGKVLAVLKDAISEQAVDNKGGQDNE